MSPFWWHQEQGDHPFPGLLRGEGVHDFFLLVLLGAAFHMFEPAAESVVDSDGNNQGNAGYGEGEVVGGVPVEAQADGPFADLDGRGRGEQGADVDGHVEEGESGIALGRKLGLVVKVAHHHLQVSFEESCPESDQEQGGNHADERHGTAAQRDGQQQVAEEHDNDAGGDHFPETELVGQDATHER